MSGNAVARKVSIPITGMLLSQEVSSCSSKYTVCTYICIYTLLFLDKCILKIQIPDSKHTFCEIFLLPFCSKTCYFQGIWLMPPRYPLFDFESTKKLLIILYTSFKSKYIKRIRTNPDILKREMPKSRNNIVCNLTCNFSKKTLTGRKN